MSKPDGRYPGTIVQAYVAEDVFDAGEYVLKLDVNLQGGGAVTCRQALKESEKEKRGQVLRALGIAWPLRSADIAALDGKAIEVNLKTSPKGNQNAYVATMREERILTPEEVDAMGTTTTLTNAAGDPIAEDDIPF